MNINDIIAELSNNEKVFAQLLQSKNKEAVLWRPVLSKWNLLEIVCHLYDEEREDFRARIHHALFTPDKELTPINPEEWVTEKNYANEDYDKKVASFLAEREQSINWLYSLPSPNWQSTLQHPKFGKLSAELFLHNWLAHDYLHIRQITRYNYLFLKYKTNQTLQYAGKW